MATEGRNRRTTRVVFDADVTIHLPIERVWAELIDWKGHARWVPMTRVDLDPADPNRFTAWSGVGKLALEDRMHATEIAFDGQRGTCHVEKLGPVLVGFADLTATAHGNATRVRWHEDVSVPYLPRVLAPAVGRASGFMFKVALKRLKKYA